jgi:proteasome lid subunit RPN8/RPN11
VSASDQAPPAAAHAASAARGSAGAGATEGGGRCVRVAADTLARVRACAEAAYPAECCGALIGDGAGAAAPATVVGSLPLANEATYRSWCRFHIGSDAVRAAERAAAACGRELVGFYHSHPDHPAVPSREDLAHAWPWYTYLIVSVDFHRAGVIRAWTLRDDRTAFDEADVIAAGP